ncbi:MAG: peptidoglycan DD-metalloendopeptidase family protein [Chloroflexi bacterium]|nr:peptidoglycan DD-metalloendopeptidase family protein [Chloroflexota bacterium]
MSSPTPRSSTPTPTDSSALTPSPTATILDASAPPILYYAQAGDTLPAISRRFGVNQTEILSPEEIPANGLIDPDQLLMIPQRLANTTPADQIMPDSEIVFSASASNFDVITYVNTLGGYLSTYREYLGGDGWASGAEILLGVASDNSINPRVLLSLLEYQGHWVLGQPQNLSETDYPLGFVDLNERGLRNQLIWAVNQLSTGYYGWRAGTLIELNFIDGSTTRLAPDLNAGSVAVQYFFNQIYSRERWAQSIDQEIGFAAIHATMFGGDPTVRANQVEPLFPPGLAQPEMILPFLRRQTWSFTGGPHGAWEREGAQAALDFAPGSMESGCAESDLWALAAASGLVVRKEKGVVVLDLDGDGNEQTGWVLLYLHLSNTGGVPVGRFVDQGDLLGNPSCEGGISTGTHLHIARKYNGEWIAADGAIPFIIGGWQAHAGDEPYEGSLTRDDETIPANFYGTFETLIIRSQDDP